MSEMACNPYAAHWAETCGAMTLPPSTVVPYEPDAQLFTFFALPEPSPVEVFPARHEDELTALALWPSPRAQASPWDGAPVSEPAGALLLTAGLLVGLWRMSR